MWRNHTAHDWWLRCRLQVQAAGAGCKGALQDSSRLDVPAGASPAAVNQFSAPLKHAPVALQKRTQGGLRRSSSPTGKVRPRPNWPLGGLL